MSWQSFEWALGCDLGLASTDTWRWKAGHNDAVTSAPHTRGSSFDGALVNMLKGWYDYAALHEDRFEAKVAEDYVLGPQWFAVGTALLVLLNGDTGRLDAGTVDRFIRDTMVKAGYTAEQAGNA